MDELNRSCNTCVSCEIHADRILCTHGLMDVQTFGSPQVFVLMPNCALYSSAEDENAPYETKTLSLPIKRGRPFKHAP